MVIGTVLPCDLPVVPAVAVRLARGRPARNPTIRHRNARHPPSGHPRPCNRRETARLTTSGRAGGHSRRAAPDLTEGTGRCNLGQGVAGTSWGLGAAPGNGVAGYIVDAMGFGAAFLVLAGCVAEALLLVRRMVPETQGWARRRQPPPPCP